MSMTHFYDAHSGVMIHNISFLGGREAGPVAFTEFREKWLSSIRRPRYDSQIKLIRQHRESIPKNLAP